MALAVGWPAAAFGDEGEAPPTTPLDDRRYELAGFPVLGGSTDIGVQFGAAATLTRFYDRTVDSQRLHPHSHWAPRVWRCATVLGVRSAQASGHNSEPPEVTALRKKIRGEALTDEEAQLLARVSRRPEGGAPISQEQMTALVAERKRRGE
jgi:hypothetical protein